jgi:CheY-like chemotaxis protein
VVRTRRILCNPLTLVDPESPELVGLRVLLVDDDDDSRDSMTMLLRVYGAAVTAVGSTREALAALSEGIPDVLLSDLSMPGEDGYALIRKVRALPAHRGGHVPAAAVTARVTGEDRARVLAAGFQAHVPKPVDAVEFATVVARLGTPPASPIRV